MSRKLRLIKRIEEQIQPVIFKKYPNCSDLKRTWDCANRIAKSLIDSGYINLPEPPEIKGE